jgi:uncharacterized protein (TIGR03663 family)
LRSYETEPRTGKDQINTTQDAPGRPLRSPLRYPNDDESQSTVGAGLAPILDAHDNDQELVEQPPRRIFKLPTPPSRGHLFVGIAFWGVILLGAVLRFWGLGDKPLHHDESLHAYFSLQLMHNLENWAACFNPAPGYVCYQYNPLLHGPFQFHMIALVYKISQLLGVYDNGVNTFTVRIAAATLGTVIVGLPYFLRDYLGKFGAWIACFLLAVSPSMVYYSRFAREDIYFACFTLLLVVAVARYLRSRKMRWIVIAAAAFSLAYATKESTFLLIAIFGSFMVGLFVWEIGARRQLNWHSKFDEQKNPFVALIPRTVAPIALLIYILVGGIVAKIAFGWIKFLSIYVTSGPNQAPPTAADNFVAGLKNITLEIVPYVGIFLGLYVMSILIRESLGKMPPQGRRGLAKMVDPQKQPLLDTILTMPWMHWFFALLCAWAIFLVLFTVVFTNIKGGIGDGIWEGLYYWLQQQQVARGGQPWYYYLLLIPLYEQIGVVFGLVGVVRCLLQPNRFRLFLVFWFVGSLAIYSWAAEKMPWLSIHIVIPMLLLAAIGLEPIVLTLINFVKSQGWRRADSPTVPGTSALVPMRSPKVGVFAGGTAIFGVVMAILLLLPTLHNMYEVSYVHAADGPHEMLVYVQTTTDVNIVMQKIDALDKKLYGGKHLLPIGVMNDAVWPFVWYLRDYKNVCLYFPDSCPNMAKTMPVIISGGDNLYDSESKYDSQAGYVYHQYHMRSWWDEGYKPPPCVPTKANDCAGQPTWGGVGPGLWLSYGDNPPPGATFNPGLATLHIWQWWWQRRAIGSTDGNYDMALFIRSNLGETP